MNKTEYQEKYNEHDEDFADNEKTPDRLPSDQGASEINHPDSTTKG